MLFDVAALDAVILFRMATVFLGLNRPRGDSNTRRILMGVEGHL